MATSGIAVCSRRSVMGMGLILVIAAVIGIAALTRIATSKRATGYDEARVDLDRASSDSKLSSRRTDGMPLMKEPVPQTLAGLVAEGSKYYPSAATADIALSYFQAAMRLAP